MPQQKAVSWYDVAMLVCSFGILALLGSTTLLSTSKWAPSPLHVVHLALLVPICEELYFRGLLLSHLQRGIGTFAAVVCSSVLFALLHQPFGSAVAAGILALLACLLVLKGRSLVLAIQLHVVWNGATLLYRIAESVSWIGKKRCRE